MAVYDDIVFPTDISFHSPGGPRFLTKIVKLPSGWHQADIKRDTPLCEWDVGYGARQAGKIPATSATSSSAAATPRLTVGSVVAVLKISPTVCRAAYLAYTSPV